MAAQHLESSGQNVIVVDREERVGGRMITEHFQGGWADTGAQFFTVREPQFGHFVEEWQEAGLVFEWSTGWSHHSFLPAESDQFSRFAAYGGLNAIPRHLAQDLVVHKAVTIQAVMVADGGWTAVATSGTIYESRAIILALPVPQALAVLAAGQVALAAADQAALNAISYAPCITAVCHVEGSVNLPEPGVIQRPDHPIRWIADNQRKGISPETCLLSVHIHPTYSQLWWQSPDGELEGAMRRELRPFLAANATVHEIFIHRWTYALPTTLHSERTLLAAGLPPLAFAGDAFNGPRVEGAALSGIAAAEAVLGMVNAAKGSSDEVDNPT